MPHDREKYLYDILNSCEFLEAFTAGRTTEDYRKDRGFRSAVERELQIIGEAVMQLDRLAPDTAARISDYRNIIGFRHVLVHGYDSVRHETLWSVVNAKLSVLASEVRAMLDELDADHGGG